MSSMHRPAAAGVPHATRGCRYRLDALRDCGAPAPERYADPDGRTLRFCRRHALLTAHLRDQFGQLRPAGPPARPGCTATTRRGTRCSRRARPARATCWEHAAP